MLPKSRFLLVLAASSTLFASQLSAQRDFSDVEIQVQQVSESVYILIGRGGNIGLSVGSDGAFVIDDQFAPLTEKIKEAIRTVTDAPIEFVLNTHWHGDHTGGNENFGGEGAMIVAHDNVFRRLNPEDFADLLGNSRQAEDAGLPKITFSETMTFHWNDEDIFIFHPDPAHTDGDAIVSFMKQNVVHMGDTFFNGFYPFIDVNSGGDVDGMITAAEAVLARSNSETQIIPGHGPLSNPDELREYRDMLITVRDRVLEMKNDGLSEDAVVESAPTSDLDDDWMRPNGERGRDGMIRFIYRSAGG
jgi:cyclase